MRSYQLINPVIVGTFKDTYDAKQPIDAANKMWQNFTEHVVSHVPNFMFTMRDVSSGDVSHFQVKENKGDNSYKIDELDLKIDKKVFDDFLKKVDKYSDDQQNDGKDNQSGGRRKRYDDDSSSSSSSSDIYPTIRRTSPIAMFHYNTRVYFTNDGPNIGLRYNPNPNDTYTYQSTQNPQIVAVTTPVFAPVFAPALGTFVGIWP